MPASNVYEVTLQQAVPRGIAAVRARVHASRIAADFRTYLDQVYAAARAGSVQLDGQNIFVYREVQGAPGQLDVEFGVGVAAPFAGAGSVVYSATPGGKVATTTHWGDYGALRDAHAALVAQCRARGISLAGPSWEVYDHWREGAIPRTDIYYLLPGDLPRGETRRFHNAEAVWQAVAALIEDLGCTDRCAEYTVDGSVRSYEWVDAWLRETIANGHHRIRYVVDPDFAGLVRVDLGTEARPYD